MIVKYQENQQIGNCFYLGSVSKEKGRGTAMFVCGFCGSDFFSTVWLVRTYKRESCGCQVIHHQLRHGKSNSSEYRAWRSIQGRCYNKKVHNYHNYGGRGIKVCERWLDSFDNFYADMGDKPSPLHSIDRINSNGDYEPDNCKWATKKEQARNTRRNVVFNYKNENLCISELCEKYSISYSSVWARLRKGYSIEQAIEMPYKYRKNKYK